MKSAMVLSFSDLQRDPRVSRQLRWLRDHYRVTAIGLADPGLEGVDFISPHFRAKGLTGRLRSAVQVLTGRAVSYYFRQHHIRDLRRRLTALDPDVLVANDIAALPLAVEVARGRPVVFDAHEYAPGQFTDRLLHRLFVNPYRRRLCSVYIPRVAAMTTVSSGIAEAYEADTGVRSSLLLNLPEYEGLEPRFLRRDADNIRLIHHGFGSPSRRIENMIRAMRHLDARFTLDLMLVGTTPGYRRRLEAEVGGDERIRFIPPVPMPEIARFTNRYDVGVFLLEPVNFNYLHALPNKLFEFIQARLAVAIGPSPAMAEIVRGTGCGIVSDDFTPVSFAQSLAALTPERINQMKRRSHDAAPEYSAERSRAAFLNLVERVIAQGEVRECAE